MKFRLKGERTTTILSPQQLIELLVQRIISYDKDHLSHMSTEFTQYLSKYDTLGKTTIEVLIQTSFKLGYLYRLFIEKNNPEIINESTSIPSDNANNNDGTES